MTTTERRFMRHVQARYDHAVKAAFRARPARRRVLLRAVAQAYQAEWDYFVSFRRLAS